MYAPQGTHSVKNLDWPDIPLLFTGVYIDEIRMVWYNGKEVRCQDLPF